MDGEWNLFPNGCLKVLDLFVWDRCPHPLIAHETKHAGSPQNLQTFLGRLDDSDEGIATKQGDFHLCPPVAPLAYLLRKGKKCTNTVFLQVLIDALLMSRHGMNRIPAGVPFCEN